MDGRPALLAASSSMPDFKFFLHKKSDTKKEPKCTNIIFHITTTPHLVLAVSLLLDIIKQPFKALNVSNNQVEYINTVISTIRF
jgi:hypothetical protein